MRKELYENMLAILLCTAFSLFYQEVPMTDNFKTQFDKAYRDLGGMGERVLG